MSFSSSPSRTRGPPLQPLHREDSSHRLQGCPHPGRGARAVTGYRYWQWFSMAGRCLAVACCPGKIAMSWP